MRGPDNVRLLGGALHYAKEARRWPEARPTLLDRMLECQLAAELVAPAGFGQGPSLVMAAVEAHQRALDVAELLVGALRPDGQ